METTFNGDLVWDHLGFATFTTINVEMDSILGCNNILLFRATASMDGWMLDSVSALFVAKHSHCIAEMPNECNEIEIPASSALETHTHTQTKWDINGSVGSGLERVHSCTHVLHTTISN